MSNLSLGELTGDFSNTFSSFRSLCTISAQCRVVSEVMFTHYRLTIAVEVGKHIS